MDIKMFYAEWIKIRRSMAFWGVFIATVVLLMTFIGSTIGRSLNSTQEALFLSFPQSLQIINVIMLQLAPIVASILTASLSGGEYSRKMWPMLLPRSGKRFVSFNSKLALLLCVFVGWIIFTPAFGLIISSLGAILLQIDVVQPFQIGLLQEQLKILGFVLLEMIFYGSLTLLLTELSKSAIFGILVGFILLQALTNFVLVSRQIALIWPTLQLRYVLVSWITPDVLELNSLNNILGPSASPVLSMTVLITYCAVFLILSQIVFYTRDFTSE